MLHNEKIAMFKDGKVDLAIMHITKIVIKDPIRCDGELADCYRVYDNIAEKSWDFEEIGDAIERFETMINVNYFLYD